MTSGHQHDAWPDQHLTEAERAARRPKGHQRGPNVRGSDIDVPSDLVCPCGQPIANGQYILKVNSKWVHADCRSLGIA